MWKQVHIGGQAVAAAAAVVRVAAAQRQQRGSGRRARRARGAAEVAAGVAAVRGGMAGSRWRQRTRQARAAGVQVNCIHPPPNGHCPLVPPSKGRVRTSTRRSAGATVGVGAWEQAKDK